jgi:hypothetical protein
LESWSRLATDLAVTMGSRCGTSAMPVPSLSLRVAAHRNMRVLADEQRLVAAVFERAGELGDIDAIVGRKVIHTGKHECVPLGIDARSTGSHPIENPQSG